MTVKEFYDWCIANGCDEYTLECYGITPNGDISYRTEVDREMIHKNSGHKTISMWDKDDDIDNNTV